MNSSVNLFDESELSRYDLGIPEYYVNENGEATIYIEPSLFVNPIDAETEQLQVESYCISITADRLEDLEEKEDTISKSIPMAPINETEEDNELDQDKFENSNNKIEIPGTRRKQSKIKTPGTRKKQSKIKTPGTIKKEEIRSCKYCSREVHMYGLWMHEKFCKKKSKLVETGEINDNDEQPKTTVVKDENNSDIEEIGTLENYPGDELNNSEINLNNKSKSTCQHCEEIYSLRSIIDHEETCDKYFPFVNKIDDERPYQCQICSKKYANRGAAYGHITANEEHMKLITKSYDEEQMEIDQDEETMEIDQDEETMKIDPDEDHFEESSLTTPPKSSQPLIPVRLASEEILKIPQSGLINLRKLSKEQIESREANTENIDVPIFTDSLSQAFYRLNKGKSKSKPFEHGDDVIKIDKSTNTDTIKIRAALDKSTIAWASTTKTEPKKSLLEQLNQIILASGLPNKTDDDDDFDENETKIPKETLIIQDTVNAKKIPKDYRICNICSKEYHWRAISSHHKSCQRKNAPKELISVSITVNNNDSLRKSERLNKEQPKNTKPTKRSLIKQFNKSNVDYEEKIPKETRKTPIVIPIRKSNRKMVDKDPNYNKMPPVVMKLTK